MAIAWHSPLARGVYQFRRIRECLRSCCCLSNAADSTKKAEQSVPPFMNFHTSYLDYGL